MSDERPERIFHVATHADWAAARESGAYTTSTSGRTLADEGYIHACRREQVAGVFARHYRDVREPLVLLTIAPERLDAEVRHEPVGTETFPHVYGPITPSAVVATTPLSRTGRSESAASLFLTGMLVRMAVALAVMAASLLGSLLADTASDSGWAPLVGALAGLVAAGAGAVLFVRRAARGETSA